MEFEGWPITMLEPCRRVSGKVSETCGSRCYNRAGLILGEFTGSAHRAYYLINAAYAVWMRGAPPINLVTTKSNM